MYDAYNANREQWQCACTIALPRCSLSSTKIHKNPELLASRDKEMKLPMQNVKSANEVAVKNKIYKHLQRRFSSSLYIHIR